MSKKNGKCNTISILKDDVQKTFDYFVYEYFCWLITGAQDFINEDRHEMAHGLLLAAAISSVRFPISDGLSKTLNEALEKIMSPAGCNYAELMKGAPYAEVTDQEFDDAIKGGH